VDPGPGGLRVEERDVGGVHHVLAGGEDAAQVVDDAVGSQVGVGRVAHAVGVGVEQQGVGVLGGDDADRVGPADLPRVPSGLLVGVDPQTDQLQVGMGGDGGHGVDADRASGPLDDSVAHGSP
jgi:hypothetical protein